MPTLKQFRSFDLAQDEDGNSLELERTDRRVVCLAFDTRRLCFAELCALVGDGGLDPEETRIFTERAQVAAALSHPQWAELFDSGIDDGVFFYAREFVDGERLGDYVDRLGALPDRVALEIIVLLGEAMLAVEGEGGLLDEIDLNDARIFIERQGKLGLKMPGFPLEPGGRVVTDAGGDVAGRLCRMLERFQPNAVAVMLRDLGFGDERMPLLECVQSARRMRVRYAMPPLEGEQQPRRVLQKLLFERWEPKEFLSEEFELVSNADDPWNPYSETLRGPNDRHLRLQVLPPARILQEKYLSFYKAGVSASAIAVHAQWTTDDFRLVAEESTKGLSLAAVFEPDEELNPADASLLLGKVDAAIAELEREGTIVPDFQPENVFVCFENSEHADTEAIRFQRPVTTWPLFAIRVRTHLTMMGLVNPPDSGVRRERENVIFDYLALRRRGLQEQAAAVAAEVSAQAKDADFVARIDHVIPGEREEPEVEESKSAETAEPNDEEIPSWEEDFGRDWGDYEDDEGGVQSGFDQGEGEGLWENGDEEDFEYEEEEEGVDGIDEYDDGEEEEEIGPPVLSPIAAAMGVHADDEDDVVEPDMEEMDEVEYPGLEWKPKGRWVRLGYVAFFLLVVLAGTLAIARYAGVLGE